MYWLWSISPVQASGLYGGQVSKQHAVSSRQVMLSAWKTWQESECGMRCVVANQYVWNHLQSIGLVVLSHELLHLLYGVVPKESTRQRRPMDP